MKMTTFNIGMHHRPWCKRCFKGGKDQRNKACRSMDMSNDRARKILYITFQFASSLEANQILHIL